MHFCDGQAALCRGRCMGAWHGGFALGGACFIMFGVCFEVPEPVTSLLGGCYMKWILHLGKSRTQLLDWRNLERVPITGKNNVLV